VFYQGDWVVGANRLGIFAPSDLVQGGLFIAGVQFRLRRRRCLLKSSHNFIRWQRRFFRLRGAAACLVKVKRGRKRRSGATTAILTRTKLTCESFQRHRQ
jgi:hypothetical protein